MKENKTYFNWSSGKDASLALYYLTKKQHFKVDCLVTSVNSHYRRVSMHGLKIELLQAQAEAIGIPLTIIELPENPTMEHYNKIMQKKVTQLQQQGYTDCGFGDIFLEDLRNYREKQLSPFQIKCHFPLWKKNTKSLINNFLDLGFKAILICVKSEFLDSSYLGRVIDKNFIDTLPTSVDPCGENGEFHTFCYDGPIFKNPIAFKLGEKVYKEYKNPNEKEENIGFWFQDLDLIKTDKQD